ncbi:hypothetical protein FB45DRAFT_820431 [Roridomyces roridus]|uniref:J domain-containing protein n=1 Tax=Roridomyces roridus TaxID=1738132 RepID=A0AAD7G2R3_9AGAR|nr:hypothetical protein FB45DRAFT_820431 [Roridomyces roridus]
MTAALGGSWSRFTHLPPQIQCLVHARLSSTASGTSYSFPKHQHPTPHEIFHLPRSASQVEIKKRYIELVRLHHPDSSSARDFSPEERHKRFQMVSSAYDALRIKPTVIHERDRTTWEEIARRKRAQGHYSRHSRRAEYEYAEWKNPHVDDRWFDRVILAFGFTALVAGLVPMLMYPRQRPDMLPNSAYHLSEARREALMKYNYDRARELESRRDNEK